MHTTFERDCTLHANTYIYRKTILCVVQASLITSECRVTCDPCSTPSYGEHCRGVAESFNRTTKGAIDARASLCVVLMMPYNMVSPLGACTNSDSTRPFLDWCYSIRMYSIYDGLQRSIPLDFNSVTTQTPMMARYYMTKNSMSVRHRKKTI